MNRIISKNVAVLILFIVASLLFAYLNRFCSVQQIALNYHINLMHFYQGVPGSYYSLYPLWGYPIIMSLFKNTNNIIYLQAFLYGLLSYFIYITIQEREKIKNKILFILLLVLAFPVYAVVSSKWPASFQLIFLIASLLLLFIAVDINSKLLGLIAGLFLGLSSNFRSEYVYFSSFLLLFLIFFHFAGLIKLNKNLIKIGLIYLIFTWVAVLPIGFERLVRTGNFNLKVGNGDWVNVFFAIGQLPDNSLSLKFDDEFSEKYLENNIIEKYDTSQPIHMQRIANDFCKQQFLSYVQNNKVEYAKKLIHNAGSIFLGGFFIGQVEKSLMFKSDLNYTLFKEYFKIKTGRTNSFSNLKILSENGMIKDKEKITDDDISLKLILSVLPLIILNLVFIMIFILTISLLVLRFFHAYKFNLHFTFSEVLFLSPIIYGSLLMIIGLYENRFSSMFYLFVIISLIIQLSRFPSITNYLKRD